MKDRVVSRRHALASMALGALAPFVPSVARGGALPGREEGGADPVEREAYLMGTVLRGHVHASGRREGLEALEGAFAEVRRVEGLLSTWRPDTELARLNRARPGEPVPLSAEVGGWLREARELSGATAGAFDPAVGALVDAWGQRTGGRIPSGSTLAAARRATGLNRFHFDDEAGAVTRLDPGAWIDSGGFGKGAGIAAAAAALRERGVERALLDFGGQLLLLGGGPDGAAWPVHVADPVRRHRPAARLAVRDRSVATSAASERWVEVDGERMGHVLDPHSGRPVPAWGSVTVVAPLPVQADALSTALFVLGPDAALDWAEERADVGVLVLTPEPGGVRARSNRAMGAWLVETATDHRS